MKRLLFIITVYFVFAGFIYSAEFNYIPRSDNPVIVRHKYYTLSYVDRYKDPEWVAYKLDDYMTVGVAERSNKFKSDPEVPGGSAIPGDYTKSGYDRGHLCPAADMKWDTEAMDETFYMSNMTPQMPGFNRGVWKKLEEQVREWAVELKEIYVVTGPILEDDLPMIGNHNKVSVPKYFYKIVLEYNDYESKAISFLLPNESSAMPLINFVVPIDSIETLTHINFFPSLSKQQSEELETKVNVSQWRFSGLTHMDK